MPGKLSIRVTKPMTTARDLSLAYSPGVAEACMEIHAQPGQMPPVYRQGPTASR